MLGVLLVVALTLLPWQSGGPAPTAAGGTGRTAVQPPGAAAGILAALATAALVVWLAAAVLPARPRVSCPDVAVVGAAGVVLVLVLVKLLTDRTDVAVGAWASILLAAALVGLRATGLRRTA